MAGASSIEWTDRTWNPVVGCDIVSPGCKNCYAMRQAFRIEAMGGAPHYAGLTRKVNGHPVWTGVMREAPEHVLTAPLRWKKPARIFVNSMSDLFADGVSDETIDKVFAVMAAMPEHIFQVLTKRPDRMRTYLTTPARFDAWAEIAVGPMAPSISARLDGALANVWLGVSAEDQTRFDERWPHLRETPAAVRFLSAEPLLGPLEILPGLDWVIAGGESGPGARPMHQNWPTHIRDDCATLGIPFFFKQWGEWAPHRLQVISRYGTGAPDVAWPDGSIAWGEAEARGGPGTPLHPVGKKAAGRRLDGRIHDAMPEPR